MALRAGSFVVLTLFALTLGPAARAQVEIDSCPAHFNELLAEPVFAAYPATIPKGRTRALAPNVSRGQAHLFRTAIRLGAKGGANFAGDHTLVKIGCGAATICIAIVNRETGKVTFPRQLRNATALSVDTGAVDVETLNFRPDSRLLVVSGTTNEDPKREGISYFVWRSEKLEQFRFVPKATLCRPK